ncbi:MAG TPA: DUF4202 domain-containing protein [Candidatus Dormibacteraeota bacterium]|nr:DUF4202 domain-containing protein [Candidatus Dormibacteraeota bacterium]
MTGNHGLVEVVRTWVRERSPQSQHLERTLAWVMELEPAATEDVQIAALSHDMERAFPHGSPRWEANRGWQDPLYDIAHTERSARFVGDFLRDHGAPEPRVREVLRLILAHESGGWPDADVIQAADSLSFLETMGRPVATWVLDGRATEQQARQRLEHAVRRIRHQRASEIAAGMLPMAMEEFETRLAAGP